MSRRVLLLLLIVALALTLGFWSFAPREAIAAVRFGGYWFTLVATACFVVTLVRSLRGDAWSEIRAWRGWWKPVAVTLLATGFLHVHERHEIKIVADEVLLGLTAKSMHTDRQASVVVRGYDYAGNFTPMASYVDKRPLFFPFLLATVHDLTGFRPENVFALNAGLSALFMLLVLLVGRRIGGWPAGLAGVALFAGIPLIAQNAAGAGFELLNLLMIVLALWLGMRAAEQPRDPDRLGAFVLCGALLAQVRYESVLFILPVGVTVVYCWWRARELVLPWSVLVTPLLLVICPLHYNVFKVFESSWQMSDIAGADVPFSFRYFYDNVGHALNFFLSFDGAQPSSALVAMLGAIAVGFLVLVVYREHREIFTVRPGLAVFLIFMGGLAIHTGFMLCYFWGHWDDPIIRRLSLPANLMLVIAIVFIWPRLVRAQRSWSILGGLAAAWIACFALPANAKQRFNNENFAARTTNWIAEHVKAVGSQSALAVDPYAQLVWILHGKSSVTAVQLAEKPEGFALHFRNRSFANFFLVQRLTPNVETGGRWMGDGDHFGGAFKLEMIEERAFAPLYLVRINRIVDVDEEKLVAWAKQRKENPPPPPAKQNGELSPTDNEQLLLWLRQLP